MTDEVMEKRKGKTIRKNEKEELIPNLPLPNLPKKIGERKKKVNGVIT